MPCGGAFKTYVKTLHFKADLIRFVSGCDPGYFWSNLAAAPGAGTRPHAPERVRRIYNRMKPHYEHLLKYRIQVS